jgi:hypothetical protein
MVEMLSEFHRKMLLSLVRGLPACCSLLAPALGIFHILTRFRRVVMNIDLQWSDIKDDDTVISIAREIMEKAVALGKVEWFRTSFPHH